MNRVQRANTSRRSAPMSRFRIPRPSSRIRRFVGGVLVWVALRSALLGATLSLGATASAALDLSGQAEVIDSDILRIDGYRVFLIGVESVEQGQPCAIDGRVWDCWAAAVRALQTIVAEGETQCQTITEPDVLNQVIARCSVNGEDVGERFIRSGYGLALIAETEAYLDVQAAAADEAIGLWQGLFLPPAEWRRANGFVAADRPSFDPAGPIPR